MNIETKLSHIVKILFFGDFPNWQELYNGYESLKKVFNSPTEDIIEAIKQLKGNPFYRRFKLDSDPQFFKIIINNTDNINTIESLLDMSSEMKYSQQEEKTLKQRLNILISLSILDDDLNKANEYEEFENNTAEDNVFEVYFEDFQELKSILASEKITPEQITWFLYSDLFEFISGAPDCFDTDLKGFYKILLENAKITTRKDFFTHKLVLNNKAKKAKEEKEPFDYDEFFSILNSLKKEIIASFKKPLIPSGINTVFKLPRAAVLTPIARMALHNNLNRYM